MALDRNRKSSTNKNNKGNTNNSGFSADPFSVDGGEEPKRKGSSKKNNKKKSNKTVMIVGIGVIVVIIAIVGYLYSVYSNNQKQLQIQQQQQQLQQQQQAQQAKEQKAQVQYTDGFVPAQDAIKSLDGKAVQIDSLKGATSEIKIGFVNYNKHATMLSDGMLYCYLDATYEGKYKYVIQVPLSVYNNLTPSGIEPVIMEIDTLPSGQQILSDMKVDTQYKQAIEKYGNEQAQAQQQIQSKAEQAVQQQQEQAQQAYMNGLK